MLIEFRVANFRSFLEEQTFSMVASKDDKHPGNLIEADGFNLLKCAAVYGANASGKSNLIRAIAFMDGFIENSATKMNLGDPIEGIVPFKLDRGYLDKPSHFSATFLLDGTWVRYGFSATREQVHGEWIEWRPSTAKRKITLLARNLDPETRETEWRFGGSLLKEEKLLKEKTRPNGLALSRGAELNIKPLSDIFLRFRDMLRSTDASTGPSGLVSATSEGLAKDAALRNRVTELTRQADFGIDELRIEEEPIELPSRLTLEERTEVQESLQRVGLLLARSLGANDTVVPKESNSWSRLAVHTRHRLPGKDGYVDFDMDKDESNGTRRFFAMSGPLLDALDKGALVVVDELDCSMHPLLVRKLIELFQSPDANKSGAQLIFTTHDSTLMDPELFRRDQIYLVEKNKHAASEVFSLYDFDTKDRPRNTEAFQKNYLAGRYGGVPNFGPMLEDLPSHG